MKASYKERRRQLPFIITVVFMVMTSLLTLCTIQAKAGLPDAEMSWNGKPCWHYMLGNIKKDGNQTAYCIDQMKGDPYGTYHYVGHLEKSNPINYALYHGYPNTMTIGGTTFDANDKAEAATVLAVWMLCGTTKDDGTYTSKQTGNVTNWKNPNGNFKPSLQAEATVIVDAAAALAAASRANAGSVPQCAALYRSDNSTLQEIVAFMPVNGNMQLTKKSSDEGISNNNGNYSLAGAKYGIWNDDGSGTGREFPATDSNGYSKITDLSQGWYWVHETVAPKGFMLDTTGGEAKNMNGFNDSGWYHVQVSADETTTVHGNFVYDVPKRGKVIVNKIDEETGNTVPKAGFTFELLSSSNKVLQTAATDNTGKATFSNIPFGTYSIRETKAPCPYLLNKQKYNVTITETNSYETVITQKIADKTPTGRVKVAKFDKYDDNKLAGAEFTITSDNAVKRVDGSTIYTAGQAVDKITTTADGSATSKELHIGADGKATFTVKETKAAPGHIINATPQKFTLTYKDMNTADLGTLGQTWKDDTNGREDHKLLLQADSENNNDNNNDNDNDTNTDASPQSTQNNAWTDDTSKEYSTIAAHLTKECAGATFRLWNKSDEINVKPDNGKIGYALRIDSGETSKKVTMYQKVEDAYVSLASTADGEQLILVDKSGGAKLFTDNQPNKLTTGTYTVKIKDSTGKDITNFTGDKTITLKAGDQVTYTINKGNITGKTTVSVKVEEIADRAPDVKVNTAEGYYYATNVKLNAQYSVKIDGKEVYILNTDAKAESLKAGDIVYGRFDSKATHYAYKRQPILLTSDSKFIDKFTINGKDYPVQTKVADDGSIKIERIVPGSYGFGEIDVPFIGGDDNTNDYSYLISPQRYYFTVDETTGRINGNQYDEATFTNHVTSVSFTKQDVTGDGELPGASLEIRDSENNLVDSWVSTDKPHTIAGLTPGKYTLIERITPNKYDQATRIDFTVDDTATPQHVAMKDKPIHITAEIDKRQEIADPVADSTTENGDGKNRANVTKSDIGSYEYSLDYRSTSNTWTDEFTVYDPLDCVNNGLARLDSVMTAQGFKDFDGKLNVWYQTNRTPADYSDDKDKANATIDDGHVNPWITGDTRGDDAKKNDPDGDSRVIDYTGWRLWAKDVSATAASNLSVSDLHLADDEYVTAFRFEYGRVEEGFTTRTSAWDRDDLKDAHDDVDAVEYVHEETFTPDSLDSVKANLSTLVSMAYDSDGKLDEKSQAVVDDAYDRIAEANNSADSDATVAAIDDVKELVNDKLADLTDESGFADSKALVKSKDSVSEVYSRVKAALPAGVQSKFERAFSAADGAVDSGDPELIEEVRESFVDAFNSAVGSLTADVQSASVHFAPAVVRLHVTGAYVAGMALDNSARVDAYRNGGGDDLEGHDDDKVTQTPKADNLANDLVQTGVDVLPYAIPASLIGGVAAFIAKRRRMNT